MRRLLVWQRLGCRLRRFSGEAFQPRQAQHKPVDGALLLVNDMAQLIHDALEETVAGFDFRQPVLVHGRSVPETGPGQ